MKETRRRARVYSERTITPSRSRFPRRPSSPRPSARPARARRTPPLVRRTRPSPRPRPRSARARADSSSGTSAASSRLCCPSTPGRRVRDARRAPPRAPRREELHPGPRQNRHANRRPRVDQSLERDARPRRVRRVAQDRPGGDDPVDPAVEAVEADVDGVARASARPRVAPSPFAPPPVASIARTVATTPAGTIATLSPFRSTPETIFPPTTAFPSALAPPPRADAGVPARGTRRRRRTRRAGAACFSRRPTRPTGPRRSRPRARGDRERTSSRAPPGGARSGGRLSLSRETKKTRRSIDRGSGSRPPPPTWGPMRSSRTPRASFPCPHRPRVPPRGGTARGRIESRRTASRRTRTGPSCSPRR